MIITDHSSFNFRNIKECSIQPDSEMNIIYGENGQGKTNLIESIWMMTGFYSFRARKNSQLIMQGEDSAKIKTEFFSGGRQQNAVINIGEKKDLILNGVKEESPRAIMGSFFAVVFSPSTLGIVQDGPSERRKMLDIGLSLIKPNYALVTSKYLRVIDQRNALFKKFGENSRNMRDYFAPWDDELVNLGAKIIKYRLDYIEKLEQSSQKIYEGISSGREKFSFYYSFSKENISEDEIKERLRADIDKSFETDIRRTYTCAGPHSHDLVLTLDGRDARIFGSQGQQRSCTLAMKLSEAEITEKITGECPVVLLDDVMSELDEGRQKFILNFLDNRQVFITCCDPSTLLRRGRGKVFEVNNGTVKEI